MNKIYNLNSFEQLLRDILKHGYQFTTDPNELLTGDSKVYLRHDLDICLKRAYKVLEIEKLIGVESTFFFMVNSPFYNLSEFRNLPVIKSFINQSAKIGLHANILGIEKFEEELKQQRMILNTHFNAEINQISFHHPTKETMELNLTELRLHNMYNFCKKPGIEYFSDSNMNLNFINLYQTLRKRTNIQLLLHPVWWVESLKDPSDLWDILIGEASSKLRTYIKNTERTYVDNKPNSSKTSI
jgi:hypothetical protein